jgi:hypothetical protein
MRAENRPKALCWVLVAAMMILELPCGWAQASPGAGAGKGDDEGFRVPSGTILPVAINHGFSSKNARAGQVITGRIMQDVPLANGGKVPKGTKVVGAILSAAPSGPSYGGRIAFRFDQLERHHRRTAVETNLRALASLVEVQIAETPETPPGYARLRRG